MLPFVGDFPTQVAFVFFNFPFPVVFFNFPFFFFVFDFPFFFVFFPFFFGRGERCGACGGTRWGGREVRVDTHGQNRDRRDEEPEKQGASYSLQAGHYRLYRHSYT